MVAETEDQDVSRMEAEDNREKLKFDETVSQQNVAGTSQPLPLSNKSGLLFVIAGSKVSKLFQIMV